MFEIALMGTIVFLLAIWLHEYVHILYFRYILKKQVRWTIKEGCICIGSPEDYKNIDNFALSWLYASGIIAGLVVFLLGISIGIIFNVTISTFEFVYMLLLLLLYLYGCKNDFQNMNKISKKWNSNI